MVLSIEPSSSKIFTSARQNSPPPSNDFHQKPNMADRRPKLDEPRSKRQKTEATESNPTRHLAHKYDPTAKPFLPQKSEDPTEDSSNKNGYDKPKKVKTEQMDPKANPYLAHMYEDSTEEFNYSNGHGKSSRTQGTGAAAALAKFPRHGTDAAMAKEVENGPENPFNGKRLSPQYFSILKTRRNLPVHAQR